MLLTFSLSDTSGKRKGKRVTSGERKEEGKREGLTPRVLASEWKGGEGGIKKKTSTETKKKGGTLLTSYLGGR